MKMGLEGHILPKEPLKCYRCGNPLKGLTRLYKGKNSERWYCSQDCLIKGEDWHLRGLVVAAGRTS